MPLILSLMALVFDEALALMEPTANRNVAIK
jgi:hypothetical protein